jgi:peptidoglycan/xylan/chitin deacetylase (PgdA/CDA1 family)
VALTFDDGPGEWTPEFVAALDRRHVHGTFFEVGKRIARHPELTRLVVEHGNLVGNHTWSHPTRGKGIDDLAPAAVAQEIDRATDEIREVTATPSCLLRAPQGRDKGAAFQDHARRNNLVMVNMIGTAHDYEQPKHLDPAWVDRITALLVDRGDHPIVLVHDGGGYRGNSLLALDKIITWYSARGYVFTDPLGRPFGP